MCAVNNLSYHDPLELFNQIAQKAISLYSLPSSSTIRLLNYSENMTYLVENGENGERTILRVNRPGYHTKKETEAELVWMEAIRQYSSIIVPEPIEGKNGEFVQVIASDKDDRPYHCVMFSFLTGAAPDEEDEKNLVVQFEKLGGITAHLHDHTKTWKESNSIHRPTWDYDTMIGSHPKWGRWQDGLDVTPERVALFQKVSHTILHRLDRFGKAPDRFGLIHADLRLANLLVEEEKIKVIDFDDCGFGWFLYDLASALSFIEHKEYVPDLIHAWLRGYKKIRPLSKEEEMEIPTFIMLRRLILLAWIGSHSDNETGQKMGADFTHKTAALAEKYLHQFG
ncbi:phosphotransferase enzyme family protein [Aneurinibacillus terranovensis]|uniref:phosphotransferase enzyme family protein n=1 Tax=Aneurinibacillus terranovensis TaxID=278991 RepID=UPI00041EB9F2|nr:phosphotransferase [Aneurinibacillus terranovensis]